MLLKEGSGNREALGRRMAWWVYKPRNTEGHHGPPAAGRGLGQSLLLQKGPACQHLDLNSGLQPPVWGALLLVPQRN